MLPTRPRRPTHPTRVDAADGSSTAEVAEAEPSAFTGRDEALVPLIVAAARRLKRVLADEQNEALDTLRQGEPVTEIDALVPTEDQHVSAFLAALDEELSSACAAGAAELGLNDTKTLRRKLAKAGSLTVAADGSEPRSSPHCAAGSSERSPTVRRQRRDHQASASRVSRVEDPTHRRPTRRRLPQRLQRRAARRLAPETQIVWFTDPRLTPCPDCEDNSLAGVVVSGTRVPTGHAAAPAHPGCTCLALPVD